MVCSFYPIRYISWLLWNLYYLWIIKLLGDVSHCLSNLGSFQSGFLQILLLFSLYLSHFSLGFPLWYVDMFDGALQVSETLNSVPFLFPIHFVFDSSDWIISIDSSLICSFFSSSGSYVLSRLLICFKISVIILLNSRISIRIFVLFLFHSLCSLFYET